MFLSFVTLIHFVNFSFSQKTVSIKMSGTVYQMEGQSSQNFSISSDCKNYNVSNTTLLLESNIKNVEKYNLSLTCMDIVDDENYFNLERDNGNTTLNQDGSLRVNNININNYQCSIPIQFDGSDYCCCPRRKDDLGFIMKN